MHFRKPAELPSPVGKFLAGRGVLLPSDKLIGQAETKRRRQLLLPATWPEDCAVRFALVTQGDEGNMEYSASFRRQPSADYGYPKCFNLESVFLENAQGYVQPSYVPFGLARFCHRLVPSCRLTVCLPLQPLRGWVCAIRFLPNAACEETLRRASRYLSESREVLT